MKKLTKMLLTDDNLMGVSLSDRISVPSLRQLTDAGQMIVPCKFARTGSQLYTAGQLGIQGVNAKKVVRVFRDEADVFDNASMESFRSAPVTIGHPKDKTGAPIAVSSSNAKSLQVGMLEGMPVRDEDTLGGNLVLTDQAAIDALQSGTQELSAGYLCDMEEVDGKWFQRNIRANHIAIVDKGRAGSSCRISDEALEVKLEDHQEAPCQWDFESHDAYLVAYRSWLEAEYNEYCISTDAAGKASGNTGVVDEESIEMSKKKEVEELVVDKVEVEVLPKDEAEVVEVKDEAEEVTEEVVETKEEVLVADATLLADELEVQKQLVVDFKKDLEEKDLEVEAMKVMLADAKVAAEQDVIVRCDVIENARLIADMRDLGDKSIEEIRKLVVQDQYPEKDLSSKSEAYVEAMFEMLIDSANGETPMSKLMKQQSSHIVVDAKPVDKVAEARQNMIKRQAK